MNNILNKEEDDDTNNNATVVTQVVAAATTGSTMGSTHATTTTTTNPAKVTVAINHLLANHEAIMQRMAAKSFSSQLLEATSYHSANTRVLAEW